MPKVTSSNNTRERKAAANPHNWGGGTWEYLTILLDKCLKLLINIKIVLKLCSVDPLMN